MILDYFLLFFAWVLYFFLHSGLASKEIKEILIRKVFRQQQYYRLFYSFVSLLGLFLIFFLLMIIPAQDLFDRTQGWNRFIGLMLATWGTIIAVLGFKPYSLAEFLGLKKDTADHQLNTAGLNAKMRHPLYSGLILIVVGLFFFIPTDLVLISAISILVYLPVGIKLEERKLVETFGDEYLEYKKRVPALFPKLVR
jgi:protein-S-isoprenylcysteine O-methyltransferase Ste14